MDTTAVGHVMPETLFLNVKLEQTGAPKKSVGMHGERIRGMEEKTVPFKISEGIRRNINLGSGNVVKYFITMRKVVCESSTNSKHLRRDHNQAGCEQWCLHDGHVDEQVWFSAGGDMTASVPSVSLEDR